jgi:hypothetical protein
MEMVMQRAFVAKPGKLGGWMRILVLSASALMLCVGEPGSVALAQPSSAPVLDSLHPQIEPWPAPVGHRQPRRQDLPPGTSKDEGAITRGQRKFDGSLNICRC